MKDVTEEDPKFDDCAWGCVGPREVPGQRFPKGPWSGVQDDRVGEGTRGVPGA